jgi:sulfate transport system ATP-binding protein
MGFLGEVTQLAGRTVRPHDIEVSLQPGPAGATTGTVTRVLRVGFEVKLTVTTESGDDVMVTMTRSHMRHIGVEDGSKVWLTTSDGAVSVLGAPAPVTAVG